MLRGLANAGLWADDVDAAKDWYARALRQAPYFERSGPDGRTAYAEFRIGDRPDELGIVDRRYAPPGATWGTIGPVTYWHVDDVAAALDRLTGLGATPLDGPTHREDGFVTALAGDPFGNTLGLMHSPHYLTIREQPAPADR